MVRSCHEYLGGAALLFFLAVSAAPLVVVLCNIVIKNGQNLLTVIVIAIKSPTTLRTLRFSLMQAGMSSILALAIGLPGAWLVARYKFPGRRLLKALAAVPFCVPPVLVVLAFVLYYGRNGVLNRLLMRLFSFPKPPIDFLYSFWGLVLVHGFYNFPIILQNVGEVWARIPRDREEAARLLGAGRIRAMITGTIPSLIPSILQSTALVFLFSFFSFVVVLVFGPLNGGTLEVEIYRAARLEADPASAAALALIETSVALGIVLFLALTEHRTNAPTKGAGTGASYAAPRSSIILFLIFYALFLLFFFLGPLAALAAEAFTVRRGMAGGARPGFDNFLLLFTGGSYSSTSLLGSSIVDSLLTAIPAAIFAGFAGTMIAFLLRSRKNRLWEMMLSFPLAVSGIVTALGWSFLFPHGNRSLVILVEAVSALPFVFRSVSAALASLDRTPLEAARTLGAGRKRAALDILLPAISPALFTAIAFAFSMAAGDANASILVGKGDFNPLPLLIYRLVGAYRFPEACAAGLVLAFLTGMVFFLKDKEPLHA